MRRGDVRLADLGGKAAALQRRRGSQGHAWTAAGPCKVSRVFRFLRQASVLLAFSKDDPAEVERLPRTAMFPTLRAAYPGFCERVCDMNMRKLKSCTMKILSLSGLVHSSNLAELLYDFAYCLWCTPELVMR